MGISQSDEYSEAQVREYCVTHNRGQLYQTVQLNLSIEEEHAKDIAAYVAFSLAGGNASGTISEDQFDDFKKKVVHLCPSAPPPVWQLLRPAGCAVGGRS